MRKELIQLENILNSLQKVNVIFQEAADADSQLVCEVLNALEEVNLKLFGCRRLSEYFFNVCADNTVLFNYVDYYDFDILNCSQDEILIDSGAWIGDSTLSYIHNFGTYKRIYCYEMTDVSMSALQENLKDFDNIVYRQVVVGNRNSSVFRTNYDQSTSGNFISPKGNVEIPMVKLDDDITEPVTFIKMDIEGSELEAMKGAERHIRKDKPKFAVCSYHNNHHIYEIPKLMGEYNSEYKFYMRYNGPLDHMFTSEFVTFAIP